eukprot:CAMPEP_0205815078 /NCGR_PEP_ID=MMETSP0205-20121125/20537_1 /ASSEMBLY_ACC=CAM_ASM_000278 /TAXON_ID=36767 /ORGANISM="Euplotes focardii, Strain TN1" /LENGTH=393 /DNA_ID=CAMNT_0053100407 /DNA_START=138 /DNA_END=1316 /DNA_ORIENTATION=-
MGFDSIWISPVPENFGNDYHGYAALNWYKINPYFGTADEFKSMVSAMHKRDMWLMLDVVANHVAYIDMEFEKVSPFNKEEHYHTKCQINNWEDENEVEYCRLSNLPDLNQDNSFVRENLINWVKWVIKEFDVDGLRIDTVPEVKRQFWKEYTEAADCYAVGEIFNSNVDYLASYQGPLPAVLQYATFFTARDVFSNPETSMYELRTMFNEIQEKFPDPTVLGTFADNHDNARFLSFNSNLKRYQNYIVLNFFQEGIPIVYYGTEQEFNGGNDPECRETMWGHMDTQSKMYNFISQMVHARKNFKVWEAQQVERFVNDEIYAFSRGEVLVITTNEDKKTEVTITYIPETYSEGETLVNIFDESDTVTVSNGSIDISVNDGHVKVYVPQTATVSE